MVDVFEQTAKCI
uniref:Uncharacterized protein n=1 Tax=Anopheles christyi TaxID=43041 RepID=A0A182KJ36_9DIPT